MDKEKTSDTAPEQRRFSFLGGALPLDYCNTVDWHSSPDPIDRLFRYEDLLAWATEAESLAPDEIRALKEAAAARPSEAEAVFREAIELRETLFRLLSAAAHDTDPASEDVARLNDWLARTQRMQELRYDTREYRRAWRSEQLMNDLARPIYPVAHAAVELLLSPKRADVRRCEGPPGCGWLFLDHTKNHSRRWCSMRDCGNRAKMRRFQEKKKNNRGNEG